MHKTNKLQIPMKAMHKTKHSCEKRKLTKANSQTYLTVASVAEPTNDDGT